MRSRIAFSTLLMAVLVSQGCASPLPAELPKKAPGRYVNNLTVEKVKRQFILHVPKAYDATHALPLVVLLHGFTSNASSMEEYSGFVSKADKEGFILATPEGLGSPTGWNVDFMDLSGKGQDDVDFVSRVIDSVGKQVAVDRKRIFVAGHSNGAMLAYLVGSKLGNRVAAVAGYAGVIGLTEQDGKVSKQIPDPKDPVSVMVIHGVKDPLVAFNRASKALMKAIGAEDGAKWWAKEIHAKPDPVLSKTLDKTVITRTYSGGKNGTEVVFIALENGTHNWPSDRGFNATNVIWDFFLSHPKR